MLDKVVAFGATLVACAVLAVQPAGAAGHIVDYGLYSVQSYGCDSGKPIFNCLESNVAHIATVTEVPGALGVTFGFHYTRDDGNGEQVQLVTIFPPAGVHNPAFPRAIPSFSHTVSCHPGNACHWGYTFDFPWEIVFGVWTMQVWDNGKLIVQKQFNVIPPHKKKGKPGKGTPTARLETPRTLTL